MSKSKDLAMPTSNFAETKEPPRASAAVWSVRGDDQRRRRLTHRARSPALQKMRRRRRFAKRTSAMPMGSIYCEIRVCTRVSSWRDRDCHACAESANDDVVSLRVAIVAPSCWVCLRKTPLQSMGGYQTTFQQLHVRGCLRQQPFSKRNQLGKVSCRFRADNPKRIRQRYCDRERPCQAIIQ